MPSNTTGSNNKHHDHASPVCFSGLDIREKVDYIFLYDFDDTLYPSSHVQQTNIKHHSDLGDFQDKIHDLLSLSKQHGPVYILTNARESHVVKCIEKYLPKVFQLLEDIDIVSARDLFSGNNTVYKARDCISWKSQAIRKIISKLLPSKNIPRTIHVISVGDSRIDRLATIDASGYQSKYLVYKTIKLETRPTLLILGKEISALISYMNILLANESGLDLRVAVETRDIKHPVLLESKMFQT